jgi:hypothetical protein
VIEEFDVLVVATELVQANMLRLFDIVERDYTGTMSRFSTELIAGVKHMMGECVHEISEGLHDGLNDYRLIFQHNANTLLVKTVGPEVAQFASALLADLVWNQIKLAHRDYLRYLEVPEFIISEVRGRA